MTDPHLVEAVVQAVLAQLGREEEPPCACHAAPRGCCPDRMGRLLGHGAARFGLRAASDLPKDVARTIDHTLLTPEATRSHVETLCREAREHGFATVCVNPTWVPVCAELLRGSGRPAAPEATDALVSYDYRDRLDDIGRPTLIVWGDKDRTVPVEGADEYERLIPNARKVILRDTGHVPMVERPARFNQLVGEFLAEEE